MSFVQTGHNSGKTYIHRLEDSEAQEWLDTLREAVKSARMRAEMAELHEKYGQSRWTLLRAKTHRFYNSEGFQTLTAFLILFAFFTDIVDSQVCLCPLGLHACPQ